jgi:Stress responsive A/B Barrel Domain
MILHAVLFRPKSGLTDADRQAMFAALHDAAGQIPTIRRFHIGARIRHGAAYEAAMTQDFPFAALIEFDDLSGLQTYLGHPQHKRLGELFYALQEAALAYDYDLQAL